MNEMQIFSNTEFGELKVMEIDGKVYFPATACAKILGYANPQKAIRDHCNGVNETVIPTQGGKQIMRIIPEGDLYRLIIRSKLPAAERFERWVFDEVLPTIRKTGSYGSLAAALEQMTSAMTNVLDRLERLEEREQYRSPREEMLIRKRRPTSVISRLDVETRQEVEAMICCGQYTYSEIAKHLADCGVKLSVASVWRYAQNMNI